MEGSIERKNRLLRSINSLVTWGENVNALGNRSRGHHATGRSLYASTATCNPILIFHSYIRHHHTRVQIKSYIHLLASCEQLCDSTFKTFAGQNGIRTFSSRQFSFGFTAVYYLDSNTYNIQTLFISFFIMIFYYSRDPYWYQVLKGRKGKEYCVCKCPTEKTNRNKTLER